jgi:hypothetical protein
MRELRLAECENSTLLAGIEDAAVFVDDKPCSHLESEPLIAELELLRQMSQSTTVPTESPSHFLWRPIRYFTASPRTKRHGSAEGYPRKAAQERSSLHRSDEADDGY